MTQLEVGGNQYRVGKLSAFKQLHIARRLAPLLSGLTSVKSLLGGAAPAGGFAETAQALAPLAEVIAAMPDHEVEYVINTCMEAVDREMAGGTGWQRMWNAGAKRLQFDDLNLGDLLKLTMAVVQENLGGFLPELPGKSPGAGSGAAQIL